MEPGTTLTSITKSADELTEQGLEIKMSWNFQEPREVFPWMFLKLTPRDHRNEIIISRGLCAPEATNGSYQENWRITPSERIPEGDYGVEAFFVDNAKRVWAAKSGQPDAHSHVAFSPVPLGELQSRAWKNQAVPALTWLGLTLLSRRLNLGSALRGSPRLDHYVFAFVLLVRLIALARLTSSPFLLPSSGDMHFYDDWARQILHGRFTDHFAFYGLPLYAYLLAFLYKLFGYSPFVPGFFQACLDAGTATAALQDRGSRLSKRRRISTEIARTSSAILAAAGWAFFVPAQAYSVILMPTAWFVFVFWFLVWQIVKSGTRSHSASLSRLWSTHRNHRDGHRHNPLHHATAAGRSSVETAIRLGPVDRPGSLEVPPSHCFFLASGQAHRLAGFTIISSRAIRFSYRRTAESISGSGIIRRRRAIRTFRDCTPDRRRC